MNVPFRAVPVPEVVLRVDASVPGGAPKSLVIDGPNDTRSYFASEQQRKPVSAP